MASMYGMRRMSWRLISLVLLASLCCVSLGFLVPANAQEDSKRVVIYSGAEEYRNAYFSKRLAEQFPDYEIVIDYMPTGNMAAKLQAEGTQTECDIAFDVDYGYISLLEPIFADVSQYDQSVFMEDTRSKNGKYLPEYRNGGAIIVNLDVLAEKNLKEPGNYTDLLDAQYNGLISMPNPKSSGTGYMFLKSLVNAWGEEAAFEYFNGLAENILQFTSSGSGPVNALVQGEVAVGLGMTAQAVTQLNNGVNLKILYFEEGSPRSLYGYAMIEGKQNKPAVREVFDFFYTTLVDEDKALYYPEQIYIDKVFEVENYPQNIPYANMENNTTEEKLRLLDLWEH